MPEQFLQVALHFATRETPVRRGEPVTVGLPWPQGAVREDRLFHLLAPDGSEQPLQSRVLDRWPDGSIRWCLFDFRATVDGSHDGFSIHVLDHPRDSFSSNGIVEKNRELFRLEYRHDPNKEPASVTPGRLIEDGPIRQRVELSLPALSGLELFGFADLYPSQPVVKVQLTIRNPSAATHPGGNWDLGTDGSFIGQLPSVAVSLPGSNKVTPGAASVSYRLSTERGEAFRTFNKPIELHQVSSGGANWNSTNHLNRDRVVPFHTCGYELTVDGHAAENGKRACPILIAESENASIGIMIPSFWENFPKAVSADHGRLCLDLFPDETELQGGEQKTHTFYIAHGTDAITSEPMAWCRSPLLVHASPEWYASTGAIPYLTPKATDPHTVYLALVDQALEGTDTFLQKRETIDEYGWRNFGDIYADHEAVLHEGSSPLISHYNNQYDCVNGFAVQFIRSGDQRWWSQMIECADHTCDIDIYHTSSDKAAYNGGLFWHTYHYADADTGTHRAYPKALRETPPDSLNRKMDQLGETAKQLKKSYSVGGGPSASHNYNQGLMLAYFLTGNPLYRDSAIDLARFVIRLDDPRTTPFRFLSREFTGLATESGGGGYHGPGRASGNSVLALIVGHRLTGEQAFLDKAEAVIRRVAHPQQKLEDLDLLNAELRWFYTMFLQALGRYLDYKIERNELDRMYTYGRLTLLHYAEWMSSHERPILDTPERLQYPTETWAAQDIRKVEVFDFAAKHSTGEERARYLERAEWFFQYVGSTLSGFPTRSLCRPVVLMMNHGWSRNWWRLHPDAVAPEPMVPASPTDFGTWKMFVGQKAIAMKRAKRLIAAGLLSGMLGLLALSVYLLL